MTNAQIPAKQLWQATLAAFMIGLLTLVTIIMPAEYNIDPTGIGTRLGLTALSPEKQTAAPSSVIDATSIDGLTTLILPAGSGREFRLEMAEGEQVDFEWITDGANIHVDVHGEPFNDPSGYFNSYAVATTSEMKGSFTAPFAGTHGWYFRNDGQQDVTIQLFFEGQYKNPHAM